MRKVIGLILLVVIVVMSTLSLAGEEPDSKNLKGVNYIGLKCRFNGIPISEDNIRAIYDIMESSFKKAGLRIVEIKENPDQRGTTIIPTVGINIDVMEGSKELYFTSIDLTVSKWISTWSGTDNIHTRMLTWWQKKMLAAAPKELNETIEKAVKELIDDFVIQLKEANHPPETMEEDQETTD